MNALKIPARVSKLTTVDQVLWLKDYAKQVAAAIKAAQDLAVKERLAEYVTVDVERAPNKALYVAYHGEKLFEKHCTRATRTDWRILRG